MFSDKRFLSNSIRSLVAEKNINVYAEQKHKSFVNIPPFINKEATIGPDSAINSSLPFPVLQTLSSQLIDMVCDIENKDPADLIIDEDVVPKAIISDEYVTF